RRARRSRPQPARPRAGRASLARGEARARTRHRARHGPEAVAARRADGRDRTRGDRAARRTIARAQGPLPHGAGRARHDRRVRARRPHLGADLRARAGERNAAGGACRPEGGGGLSRRRDGVKQMLSVAHLQAGYGPAQVLFDVSFTIGAGEVVTLIGRNGMGKTTTILAVMGLLPPSGGTVTFEDAALAGLPPYRIAKAGLGLVPEGRQVFPTLTVEENLVATAAPRVGERW